LDGENGKIESAISFTYRAATIGSGSRQIDLQASPLSADH
jgi:hypothetical protein